MAAALQRALGPEAAAAAPGGGSDAALPPLPVLVLGPAGSGRTSLLLRVALAGGADGPRALFLAPSAIPRLPGGPGGPGTDPRALQRLELRYPLTLPSLRRELLSLSPRPPPLLLLDGLERYLGSSPGLPARLAALLLETTRTPVPPAGPAPGPPPQLLVALRLPPPAPHVLATLLRFFPASCRLSPARHGPARITLRWPGSHERRWRLSLGSPGQATGHGDGDGDTDTDTDRHTDSGEEWE